MSDWNIYIVIIVIGVIISIISPTLIPTFFDQHGLCSLGENFCHGQCWRGCSNDNYVWTCTPTGGSCVEKDNTPSGLPQFIISQSTPITSNGDINPNYEDLSSKEPPSAIYLKDDVSAVINRRFMNDNQEFRFCLFGKSFNGGFLITDLTEPKVDYSSSTSITAQECPSSSAGFIHSHPEAGCILSEDDKNTFRSESFPIVGVICEANRFTFYTSRSLTDYIPVYIVKTDTSNNPIEQTDVTPTTPCPKEYFCNGTCWLGCGAHEIWSCTPQGGHCEADPNNCPPGQYSCIGRCWLGCNSQGSWRCTPNGGNCVCNPGVTDCST